MPGKFWKEGMRLSTHRCMCKNQLYIYEDLMEEGWRTGFRLVCGECGKKFLYKNARLTES